MDFATASRHFHSIETRAGYCRNVMKSRPSECTCNLCRQNRLPASEVSRPAGRPAAPQTWRLPMVPVRLVPRLAATN
jgi:hypothetical protein